MRKSPARRANGQQQVFASSSLRFTECSSGVPVMSAFSRSHWRLASTTPELSLLTENGMALRDNEMVAWIPVTRSSWMAQTREGIDLGWGWGSPVSCRVTTGRLRFSVGNLSFPRELPGRHEDRSPQTVGYPE